MKIAGIVLLVFIAALFCSNHLYAQINIFNSADLSKIKIDSYNDVELADMYRKATESGLSETQLYNLVAKKGLPDSEIARLKSRLELINKSKQPMQDDVVTDKVEDVTNPYRFDSSASSIPLQQFKNDQIIFGSELFTSNSLVFEPNLRIPAPSGYILGPDDEIVVSVYGYSEKKYNLKVNEQGEVYIPNIGPLLVSGLSIEEAGEKIKSKLASTIYRAITTGQTKVQVSLGRIRSIRITVIGQAKKPGTFTVSSLTSLYNILYLCGGPTSMGSYRDIEIIRGTGIKRTADLYDFLVDGDQKDNIILHEGDVIRVPYYKNRVTLYGNVKREGKFEMLGTETFRDLLKFSGGFTDFAYRGAVTVIRITDTAKKIIDLPASEFDTFRSNGSDSYIVGKLQEIFGNRIYITGAVQRPGPYELTPALTVKNLIERAGGLTVEAYTQRVSIFRYMKNKMPSILSINLDSVLDNNQTVYLRKNDSIAVHSIFEFNDKTYVSIEGNVRKPGMIEWREHLTLHDLLLAVGGLTESGDSSNIEISRRIRKANVVSADHKESQVFNINLSDEAEGPGDMYLEPNDMVIVKTMPGYGRQRSVLILGEVKSPGRYVLKNSGDKISDIMDRAGGFKASADSASITIRRNIKSNLTIEEREKLFQRVLNIDPDSISQNARLKDELYKKYDLISVDLSTALVNTKSSENLALEEGDVLTIDRNTNLVKISGEVYYPTIVPYKPDKNLKYYVEQAGNFTSYARKNGALVIHPDGKAESVKHFLWFKSFPSVSPRSEIFVPQKNKSNRTKVSLGELALLVSALGIIANVIKL